MPDQPSGERKGTRRVWRWVAIGLLIALAAAIIVGKILVRRAEPIVKGRVLETLSARFNSKIELDDFSVSTLNGLEVTGKGLRIYPPDDVIAAGATQPIISVGTFYFHTNVSSLLLKPMRIETVHLKGMQINIPPKEMRRPGTPHPVRGKKIEVEVAEFVCDDSQLVIGTAKPNKDPKVFALQHIVMKNIGPNQPWAYDAVLVNPVPRGDIHAVGKFGPWNTESAGDSAVSGTYSFDRADLNTIKGIGGILHSKGDFDGQLNRIDVKGFADVPDFSLDVANHPMPLHTQFHAVVDGTSGDTYLQPVQAKLGESDFTCYGIVVNVKGKGHIIDMAVEIPAGRIQDFLQLAMKTDPPVMTGIIQTNSAMKIPPGKQSVVQKISIAGKFALREIHFSNPEIQDKIDMLTLRAQGKPQLAKPGAKDVQSRITGDFRAGNERVYLQNVHYILPGANVTLQGVLSMDGKQFDFTGKARTQAKLSEMVATRWKSWALKVVDPFFKKNGAGAEIPFKVTGTKGSPKFGLDLGGGKKQNAAN